MIHKHKSDKKIRLKASRLRSKTKVLKEARLRLLKIRNQLKQSLTTQIFS